MNRPEYWDLVERAEKATCFPLADSGYHGELVECWHDEHGITISMVRKQPGHRTFLVAPRRRVVERSFAVPRRAGSLRLQDEAPVSYLVS